MKLSQPTKLVFLISLILFVVGTLGLLGVIDFAHISKALIAAWVVLALGCLLKGV